MWAISTCAPESIISIPHDKFPQHCIMHSVWNEKRTQCVIVVELHNEWSVTQAKPNIEEAFKSPLDKFSDVSQAVQNVAGKMGLLTIVLGE